MEQTADVYCVLIAVDKYRRY